MITHPVLDQLTHPGLLSKEDTDTQTACNTRRETHLSQHAALHQPPDVHNDYFYFNDGLFDGPVKEAAAEGHHPPLPITLVSSGGAGGGG